VWEYLPSKHEALSSNPRTAEKKRKIKLKTKQATQVLKRAEDVNWHFRNDNIKMAVGPENCLMSLVIRGMQITHLLEWPTQNKNSIYTNNTKSLWEAGTLLHCCLGMQNSTVTLKNNVTFKKWGWKIHMYDPVIQVLCIYPRKTKNCLHGKCKYVYSSFIHNTWKLEIILISFNRWINKRVHSYNVELW
jgi:hypothetical protein